MEPTEKYEGDPAEHAERLDPADPDRAAADACADGEGAAGDQVGDDPEEVLIDAVLAGEETDVDA